MLEEISTKVDSFYIKPPDKMIHLSAEARRHAKGGSIGIAVAGLLPPL